jgi:hypothetical protein
VNADLEMWNAIIAFLSATFILPIIQQPGWPTKVRALVTFVFCLIVGFITTWISGTFDAHDLITSVLTVFTVAIVAYHGFAQPTMIAPTIENATSPAGGRKQPTDDPPA